MNNPKFFIFILMFFLSGCQNHQDLSDLRSQLELIQRPPFSPIEELENVQIIQQPLNDQNNHPFQPTTVIAKPSTNQLPFRNFSLQALKLIGVVLQGKQRWALFQSPENVAIIKAGDTFSKDQAKLLKVESHKVLIDISTISPTKLLVVQLGKNINV